MSSVRAGSSERPRQSSTTFGFVVAGLAVVVGIWALIAARQPTVVVASPAETIGRLVDIGGRDVAGAIVTTGWRALRGTLAGVVLGIILGLVTGRSDTADELLRSSRALLTGAPPIVLLVLLSIWVGLDGDPTPWVAGAAAAPLVWLAVHVAVRAIDPELLEMAAGLHVGEWWTLRHVTVPAVGPAIRSSGTYAAANAFRITIMAELFVSSNGIGAEIAAARNSLDTPAVFAWALVAVAAALFLEAVTLSIRRRARVSVTQSAHHGGRLPEASAARMPST